MVRAAACGAVDFARSDPRDRRWWAGVALVLGELERLDRVASGRDRLAWYAACLARDDLEPEGRKSLLEAHQGLLEAVDRRRFPWEKAKEPKAVDGVRAKLEYEEAFGLRLDSPEGRAAIAATVAALERIRVKVKTHG